MSLLRGRVPQNRQADCREDSNECTIELTLLEAPPLPVSLARQISWLWQERGAVAHYRSEFRLPISDQRLWFRDFPAQLNAMLSMVRLAPATYDSPQHNAQNIWRDDLPDPYSWANSLLIHLFALSVMLLPFAIRQISPMPVQVRLFDHTPLVLTLPRTHGNSDASHGGGSGGNRSPLPASPGALPHFSRTQFTAPRVIVPPTTPLLPVQATLLGPPELQLPTMKLDMPFGDPLAPAGPPSQGPGTGGGIGNHDGTGVGQGKGPGFGPGQDGGCCEGAYSPGGGVSAPVPIYSPEPAYSEEARKAKYGGMVTLWIFVDTQGMVRNIKIAKSLGMGLDEEAIKAVSTWRFKPAMRTGTAVPVRVQVEVSFRLF